MLLTALLRRARPPSTEPGVEQETPAPNVQPKQLIEQHYDFIWRLLRRMGLSGSDADDATQQVFMTTLYPEPKPIRPGSERSFLYGVALNVCREHRRKRRALGLHDPDKLTQLVAGGSPERQAAARQTFERLDAVLSSMSEEVRATFVLFELEGLSAPEIAALVDIPLGTVASRLRRGREIFQERVEELRNALPEEVGP